MLRIATTLTSIALPAVFFLSKPSQSSWFEHVETQLTSETLTNLHPEEAAPFQFDVPGSSNSKRATNSTATCKVYPGDAAWPSETTWANLNKLTNGSLIKTIPQAAPCYQGPLYDPAKCATLTTNWTNTYTHIGDPVEMFGSPVYQGLTCQPPSHYDSGNCTLGGYPLYVINATTVANIQLGVNFARNTGVRLVVRNTGHDFSGKSGGGAALSIWTHYLKNISFISNYVDNALNYSGPAFKAGSGVEAYEIYKEASNHGVVVVGGEGQTVGVMGGYIQGGGHSPLSSIFGIAADQVLAYEVVLPNGNFVTASAVSYPDLFWALRGGGGSTFGVVTSVTVKAYADMPITSVTFSYSTTNITRDSFWAGYRTYLDYFPQFADAGTYAYHFVVPAGPSDLMFLMQPFFAPNKTIAETQALLQPWFLRLAALGIVITPAYTHYDSFYPAWLNSFPLEAMENTNVMTGSRLFPRSNWASGTLLNATFEAIRESGEKGATLIMFNMAPTLKAGNTANAVNPAWRKTVLHAIQNKQWPANATTAEILAARKAFTYGDMQRWRDVSPGAGCYLGESDRLEPNFQQAFYGSNYAKLLTIKKKYDPRDVFWAATAVGSEGWYVKTADGLPSENGRLCRVG